MATPTEHDFQPRWIVVRNESDEEAPAFGVAVITGIDDDGVITVDKPDGASLTNVVFIGETAIPAATDDNPFGPATMTPPAKALTDESDDAVDAGSEWGTEDDSWMLRRNGLGFIALAEIATGLGLLRQSVRPDETIRVGVGTDGGVGVTYQYGTVTRLNPATDIRSDAFECLVVEANGRLLSADTYVHGKFIGFRDTDGSGASSSIAVYEAACCDERDPTNCPCDEDDTWELVVDEGFEDFPQYLGTFCLEYLEAIACTWEDEVPTGAWRLQLDGDRWRLIAFWSGAGSASPDAEYELDADDFVCDGENTFDLVSGPVDAPATLTITPGCEGGTGSGEDPGDGDTQCPGSYSASLHATITPTGCGSPVTVDMTWNGSSWDNTSDPASICGTDLVVYIARDGSDRWRIVTMIFHVDCPSPPFSSAVSISPDSVVCSPLSVIWTVDASGCGISTTGFTIELTA